jgi:hypothetical protein
LSANGEQVSNVFPYDSQGRPLAGVQLYDQDGHPLEIGEDDRYYDDGSGSGGELVPGSEAGTPARWNVYPMQVRKANPVNGELEGVEKLPPPFTAVPPLIAAPTSGATPAPDATSSSSASPTPGATPSSSAAATAGATTSSATRSTPSATK